jgi:hypothetical protein
MHVGSPSKADYTFHASRRNQLSAWLKAQVFVVAADVSPEDQVTKLTALRAINNVIKDLSMSDDEKEKYSPVKDEMYHLLLCAYRYVRKLGNLADRLRSESMELLLEEITALRHLSNEIIPHLCNLDDDSSKWSKRRCIYVDKSIGYSRRVEGPLAQPERTL